METAGARFKLQCAGFLTAVAFLVAAPRLQSTGTCSKVAQLRSGGGGVGTLGAVLQASPHLLCVSQRRRQTYGSTRPWGGPAMCLEGLHLLTSPPRFLSRLLAGLGYLSTLLSSR